MDSRNPDQTATPAQESPDAEIAGIEAALRRAARHAQRRTAERKLEATDRTTPRKQMINDRFAARFSELQHELDTMPIESRGVHGCVKYMESGVWEKWATSTESLLQAVCGTGSVHYTNFVTSRGNCDGLRSQVESLAGIFRSAKEAFEGGYLFDIERDVTGEIFGDFVVLAKRALAEDHKDVAAVLASAALEDALKRLATSNGLNVANESMGTVVNALKSKGLVSGVHKSMLEAGVQTRNAALHAQWKRFDKPIVSGLIGFIEEFLLTHFSSKP